MVLMFQILDKLKKKWKGIFVPGYARWLLCTLTTAYGVVVIFCLFLKNEQSVAQSSLQWIKDSSPRQSASERRRLREAEEFGDIRY